MNAMSEPVLRAWPVSRNALVTQTYPEHVQRAKDNGWCWQPGSGCTIYYYGGIDWGVPMRTQIGEALAGKVVKADFDKPEGAKEPPPHYGYGLRVKIEGAGGYATIYGHLESIYVQVGDAVRAGQVIGLSGSSGNSTGPHLHFELRLNGIPIDPMPFLLKMTPTPEPAPPPAPAPTPAPPPKDFKMPVIPALPRVRPTALISSWINIHDLPFVTARSLSGLHPGEILRVAAVYTDVQGNIWFGGMVETPAAPPWFGWAVARYKGETWLEVVDG